MLNGTNATVSTYRLANSSAKVTTSGSATLSNVEVYIESVRAELVAVLGENPGLEVFYMHMEPADIKVGDKVVDQDSKVYNVVAIERHEDNEDTDNIFTVTLHSKGEFYSG